MNPCIDHIEHVVLLEDEITMDAEQPSTKFYAEDIEILE